MDTLCPLFFDLVRTKRFQRILFVHPSNRTNGRFLERSEVQGTFVAMFAKHDSWGRFSPRLALDELLNAVRDCALNTADGDPDLARCYSQRCVVLTG